MTNDPYTIRRTSREPTEDGDYLDHYVVVAQGFAGVREFNSTRRHPVEVWTAKGDGTLVATFTNFIDGTEVAIERNNDYWASMRDMGAPEWAK
jgi:hypothetical protein